MEAIIAQVRAMFSICFVSLILFTSHVKAQGSCIQYYSPSVSSLHCNEMFSSCDYVSPNSGLSLTKAERDLDIVFNQALIGVHAGDISQHCFASFSSFYCRQVFSGCYNRSLANGTTVYFPLNTTLCQDDCSEVIGSVCLADSWSYLTNVIEQFKQASSIALPSLQQLADCGNLLEMRNNCISLNTGPAPTDTSCLPVTTTTTFPPNITLGATDIIAIAIAVVIAIVASIIIIFLILYLVCQVYIPKKRDRAPRISADNRNHVQETSEFKFDAPDCKEEEQEDKKRGTLMMRTSAYHNALFNVNTSPRSNTVSKRLANKEYLRMTPKQRLQELEFPHNNICLLKDLWETNFGMTYQGEATGIEERAVSTTIYVKSLRERASAKLKQQFLIEMTWASGFCHPNVITLLGVCREERLFLIYEYLEYGSLKEFLQSLNSAWFDFDNVLSDETGSTSASNSGYPLGIDDLCNISHQVANGMDYLSKKAFVMKDLAARNCQVGQGLCVKIANFGLSYDAQSKDYCSLSSAKSTPLPLRWLAPETIQYNRFSVYSDIWSFGVLLWEVFSFGTRPFEKLSNSQVVQSILSDKNLPMPTNCPESLYGLMKECWQRQPPKRPYFSVLCKELTQLPSSISIEEKKVFGGPPGTPDLRRPFSGIVSS